MEKRELRKFFLGIILPSILAISLFILSIYVIIIPAFENNIMERKKEMISQLTHTAWSLMEEYHQEYLLGNMTLDEAQNTAATKIGRMRYGAEHKDYFWIIDTQPSMIMHPYRIELIDSNLSTYQDPKGKKLFIEAVKLTRDQKEGFISYIWQWKDDASRLVPKLSYVKAFEPWGWILGTGIYLEDVAEEIKLLQGKLLRISVMILVIISIILVYIIRQSLLIEQKRRKAESKLRLSRKKYQTLVEASVDGTLMLMEGEVVFSNQKFKTMLGDASMDNSSIKFNKIFNVKWSAIKKKLDESEKSVNLEMILTRNDDVSTEVVLSISKVQYGSRDGFIVIVKDITRERVIEKETLHLSNEVQTALLLMNQPIHHLITDLVKCDLNTSISEAAKLMARKKQNVLFICQDQKIIGVVNDSDLRNRVLASGLNIDLPVVEIMSAPVKSIPENALLYEAVLMFNSERISHLAVTNQLNKITGIIGRLDVLELQQNTVSSLIRETAMADSITQLQKIFKKVPVLVNALLETGDKTQNITRIITSVFDAITHKVIEFALEEQGLAPCKFAFVALGSEGRKEQTLSTDQDNAIIFEDIPTENAEEVYVYFLELAKKVNSDLHKVGFKLCKGDVMARNPKWTQPLSVWKEYFSDWINNSSPQNLLDTSIFFDFRCVYGDAALSDKLRKHILSFAENKAVFFYHFAQTISKYKAPLSMFGSIISDSHTENGDSIDVKKILLPITGFLRIYSIKNSIEETNSQNRLEKLFSTGVIDEAMFKEIQQSYNILVQLRLRFQTLSILKGELPGNSINTSKLTNVERSVLKKIFDEIGNLKTRLNFDFKGGV